MSEIELRSMEGKDWSEVAELICLSLNYWSVANGRSAVFSGGGRATRLFCDEYEALDDLRDISAESLHLHSSYLETPARLR